LAAFHWEIPWSPGKAEGVVGFRKIQWLGGKPRGVVKGFGGQSRRLHDTFVPKKITIATFCHLALKAMQWKWIECFSHSKKAQAR